MNQHTVAAAVCAMRALVAANPSDPFVLGKLQSDVLQQAHALEREHAADERYKKQVNAALYLDETFEPNRAFVVEQIEMLAQLCHGPLQPLISISDALFERGLDYWADAVIRAAGEVEFEGHTIAEILNARAESHAVLEKVGGVS